MRAKPIRHAAAIVAVWALSPGVASAQTLPGESDVTVRGIPGVVEAGAEWELVWADFETADGIVGMPDGGVMFAQEQTDTIRRIHPDGRESVVLEAMNGPGSVSIDSQGRIFAVQRTCTEPLNPELPGCAELTRIAQVYPEYRVLASTFADGSPLGRLNDLVTDGNGGAYFTVGGVYHVDADGVVTTVADENIRTNGIMLSRDGRTLYVTNRTEVLAFDLRADGTARNRRVFGALDGDGGGDGMAIDAEGRLYVTANAGVHVLSRDGDYLGLIPAPRRAITVAFSGPDKRTLYVPMMGAVGPDGASWETPDGIRNTAMTMYRIPMLAQGYTGRPK